MALAVNQGGKRKGALAVYLENWHIDIQEFLDLRKNMYFSKNEPEGAEMIISNLFKFCILKVIEIISSLGRPAVRGRLNLNLISSNFVLINFRK